MSLFLQNLKKEIKPGCYTFLRKLQSKICTKGSDSCSELMKEMFRESIEGVKKLIKQQVTQVEEGETPKGIRCRVSVRVYTFP
jgi:uncharacterized protein YaaR (DUF327 family)